MYAIARRLPLAARKAAAAADYTRQGGLTRNLARTDDGCCPLGVALGAAGLVPDHTAWYWRSPSGGMVAGLLTGQADDDFTLTSHTIAGEAWRFIADWDNRRVRDLHTALGLRKPRIGLRSAPGVASQQGDAAPCSPTPPTPAPAP